jgi:hypothetical protein
MSSAPMSPLTNDSAKSQSHQSSTPASSPLSDSPAAAAKKADQQYAAKTQNNVAEDEEDDEEDMGTKAKALTNLLKTSSVCLQDFIRHLRCTNQGSHFRSSLRSWQTR